MKTKLIAVAAALCLISCGQTSDEPKVYTLVQYNVGAFHKYVEDGIPPVVEVVKELKADALTLNEVDSCATRTGGVDQLAEFARLMGGWHHLFAKAMPFQGGGYGVGVASAPELKVLNEYTVPLSRYDGHEPRAMAVVEYEDFVLCSTHLDLTENAQIGQIQEINTFINKIYADKPIILGGDFNCRPGSAPYELMKLNWQVLSRGTESYPSTNPDRCIDYFFGRPAGKVLKVISTRVPRKLENSDVTISSDHLPIVLTISIANQ